MIFIITNKPPLYTETYPLLFYKSFRNKYKVLNYMEEIHRSHIKLPTQLCNWDKFTHIDAIGSLLCLLPHFRQLSDFLNNAVCSFVFLGEL